MKTMTMAAGLCCCALGCGQTKTVGSQYAASALISAKSGGSVQVSASADAKLAGTKIQVPPTALAQDTTLTIAEGSDFQPQLPAGAVPAYQAVADFGPSGTRFALPVTITLPYEASGATPDLVAVGVEDDGTTLIVGNGDLSLDTNAHTASFTVAGLTRFGLVYGTKGPPCPANTALCGCNGGGRCLAEGKVCPALCPVPTGGGSGGSSGGASCCPAGEYFCGCNGNGSCVPDNFLCALNCPLENGAGGSSGSSSPAPGTPPPASCCPAGEYYCGCPGSTNGSCVADDAMCAWSTLACPAPGSGGSGGTSGGGSCCPSGEYFCGCSGQAGSCIPDGQSCVVMCPAQASSSGGSTTPPATDCCPPGDVFCGCNGQGQCIPDGQACPLSCPSTSGGASGGGSVGGGCACACPATGPCDCSCPDGGPSCPPNEVATACGCLSPNVMCVPPGCPQGETECCGQCQPAGVACPAVCATQDGGTPPPCACACPSNDPSCQCACGDAGPAPCPTGEYRCPNGQCIFQGAMCTTSCQLGYTLCNGQCIVDTLPCAGSPDAGVSCSSTETLCCGTCQPSGLACPLNCPDAG